MANNFQKGARINQLVAGLRLDSHNAIVDALRGNPVKAGCITQDPRFKEAERLMGEMLRENGYNEDDSPTP